MSLLIELPLYERRHEIRGLKIAAIIPNPRGIELHFENQRYTPIEVSDRWVHDWEATAGGYYCHEANGEPIFYQAGHFEKNYALVEVAA